MSHAETWTVKRLLEWTTDFLKKKGVDSARLEAEILLAAALNIQRIQLYTDFDKEPSEEKRTVFRDFVKRRGTGEPVAYLVGFKEFYSLPFKVDRRVLIPRPETEQLVLETLDYLKTLPPGSQPMVCDVGTGSGIIGVTVAKHWPKTLGSPQVVAVDMSSDALDVAAENAKKLGAAVQFRQSDLLAAVDGPFDVIVSNPPYISASEFETLPNDVKNFEPKLALLAGPNGTEIVQRLIAEATPKLKKGGRMLLEISPMIADRVAAMFNTDWTDVAVLIDLAGLKRIVAATRAS